MKIAILPGDGIGPEVIQQEIRVLENISDIFGLDLQFEEYPIGGVAIRDSGSPLPAETLEGCLDSVAVLLGAVGDPEFDDLLPDKRPEIGLLQLRQQLGGYANIRPAKSFASLVDNSPLRPEIFEGTDFVIVRELLGDVYFGEPRGFSEDLSAAFNTMRYSVSEVERVSKIAFEMARQRKKKVTSVDKSNVLESSRLWRETVIRVSADYPDVKLEHIYVDACAMHLVTDPVQFDIILTGNLFGDILSDEAAVLTGSLGMLTSSTVGGKVDLYEPVHGSAPDIAGENIANPLGAIGCAAMCMRQTFGNNNAANAIESAIARVIKEGFRTSDMTPGPGNTEVLCDEMGELVSRYSVEEAHVAYSFHAV